MPPRKTCWTVQPVGLFHAQSQLLRDLVGFAVYFDAVPLQQLRNR